MVTIGAILFGGLFAALAFTQHLLGPAISTLMFCLGDVIVLVGIVYLIVLFVQKVKES